MEKGPVESLLFAAQKYIEKDVCIGFFAKNSDGISVAPESQNATTWCAIGAIYKAVRCTPVAKQIHLDIRKKIRYTAIRVLNNAAFSLDHFENASCLNDQKPELVPELYSQAIEAAHDLGL